MPRNLFAHQHCVSSSCVRQNAAWHKFSSDQAQPSTIEYQYITLHASMYPGQAPSEAPEMGQAALRAAQQVNTYVCSRSWWGWEEP